MERVSIPPLNKGENGLNKDSPGEPSIAVMIQMDTKPEIALGLFLEPNLDL